MTHRLVTPPRLVATALCCAMSVSVVSGAAAVEQKRSYDLPSGDAATTLNQFAGASGQQIIFMMEKVKGERTNAIAGDYAARDALDRMLTGTGLSATRDPATGAFVVSRKRTAESKPRSGEVGPASDPQPKSITTTQPMKSLRTLLTAVAGWLAVSNAAEAQTTAAPVKEETVVLSAFTVDSSKDRGYRASNSIGGTRVNTALKDVPMNIQIVTEEFIRDLAAIDASESLRFQAGVEVGLRDADRDTQVTIRGFSTTWQMREGFRRYDTSDSVNIARQEVVAGPAAVLYGVSQPGGLINYIAKRPVAGAYVELRQMFGSYDFYRTDIDVNYAPTGPLAFRLNGARTDVDGYRDFEFTKRTFVAPVLVYKLAPATSLTLDLEYTRQDRGFTHNKLRDVSLTATGGTVNLPGFLGVSREQQWTGKDTVHSNDVKNIMAIVDHKFSDSFSVNAAFNSLERVQQRTTQTHRGLSVQALRDRNGALVLDAAGNPIKAIRTIWANDYNDNWMWQARVDTVYKFDALGAKHTLLAGFNYSKDTNYRNLKEDRNIDTRNAVDSLGQNFRYYAVSERRPDLSFGNTASYNAVSWGRPWLQYRDPIELTSYYTNYQAAFLDGSLHALAGIRYDKNDYSRQWTWRRTGQLDVKNSVTDKWSPNVGLLYRPISWLSAYALTSESLEPRNGATNSFGVNFTPSFGESLEAGLKFEALSGRVSGTASVYRIKNQNLPVNDPTRPNASGGLGDQVQVGEQTAEGVDFSAFYFPTDAWQITGGWSYVDTFISADTNRANIGRNFSNNPYNRATLFNSYRLPGGFTFGGGFVYTGEIDRGWNDAAGIPVQNDSYTLVDAFARYEFKWNGKNHASVALNVRNLPDKEDFGGGSWIEGRTYRLTFGVRF